MQFCIGNYRASISWQMSFNNGLGLMQLLLHGACIVNAGLLLCPYMLPGLGQAAHCCSMP